MWDPCYFVCFSLMDRRGDRTIGVVVAKLDALRFAKLNGDIPQNINFAIKSEVAQTFLRSNGVEPVFLGQKSGSASTAEHVQAARQYTWLVECVIDAPAQ